MSSTVLLAGTRKGLWIGKSDEARLDWSWTRPHFNMEEVYSCMIDTRGERPRLLVGSSSSWIGPQVWRSDDLGETWQETPNGAIRFPEDTDAKVERVWQLAPGTDPEVVYAGTEPGAVFRSDDRGETFTLERALWEHPQRPEWGAGYGGQAFHTVLPHPTDPSGCSCRTTVASTAPTTREPRGSRSPTDCRRTSASRSWCTPTTPTRSTSSRSAAATADSHPRPRLGSGARATRGRPGRRSARASPTRSTSVSCATRCARTATPRPGSTSVPATAPSGRRPTRARPG